MPFCLEVPALENTSVFSRMGAVPANSSAAEGYAGAADAGDDWQIARDRVLLYLRLLDTPPVPALSIALAVLRRAMRQCEKSNDCLPTKTAMLTLREVLSEQNLHPDTWWPFGDRDKIFGTTASTIAGNEAAGGLPESAALPNSLPVTPPIARGRMLPEFIDRKPVRSFFAKLFRRRPNAGRAVSKKTPPGPQSVVPADRRPGVRNEP
jgi:hypothetical protein